MQMSIIMKAALVARWRFMMRFVVMMNDLVTMNDSGSGKVRNGDGETVTMK